MYNWGNFQLTSWRKWGGASIKHHKIIIQLIVLNICIAGGGFLKDILLADYLGTGMNAAAFNIAYYLPDTLGNGMIGSALLIATTAVSSSMRKELPVPEISVFSKRLLGYTSILSGLIVLIIFLFRDYIMQLLIGQVHYLTLAVNLLVILLPILFVYPLQYILSGFLQSNQRFLLSSAQSLVISLMVTLVTILLVGEKAPPHSGVFAIAFSLSMVVIIYAFLLLVYWVLLIKRGSTVERDVANQHLDEQKYSKQLFATFGWFFIYLFMVQVIGFIERGVAARMDVAVLAGLFYAYRVAQVPNWIFISAVSTWILPSLSMALAMKNHESAKELLANGIKLSLLSAIPAEVFFVVLAKPIISILFARGAFTASSVAITAGILRGYGFAVLPLAISTILYRYFAADRKMALAVLGAFFGATVNIGFDLIFANHIGLMGLGIGSTLGNSLNLITLIILMYLLQPETFLSIKKVLRYFMKLLIPVLFTIFVSWFLVMFWNGVLQNEPFVYRITVFAIVLLVWGIGYLLVLYALKLIKFSERRVIIG